MSLSIAGTELEYFHICAFFNSKDDEYNVLGPFFKEGLDQGDKNLHIVNPEYLETHKLKLAESGIDAHACQACGQLEVVRWEDAYFDETGTFDKKRMLAVVDHLTGAGLAAGFNGVRVMGNMDWAAQGVPGSEQLIEYEAEVNAVLARNRQPAVCVYDIAKLSGGMMMDLLRTHPLTLIGGVVQENPFFTEPAQMLEEMRAKAVA